MRWISALFVSASGAQAASLAEERALWQQAMARQRVVLHSADIRRIGDALKQWRVTLPPQDLKAERVTVDLPELVLTELPKGGEQLQPRGTMARNLRGKGGILVPTLKSIARVDRFPKGDRLTGTARAQTVPVPAAADLLTGKRQGDPDAVTRFRLDLSLDQMVLRWFDPDGLADSRSLALTADRLRFDDHHDTLNPGIPGQGHHDARGLDLAAGPPPPPSFSWPSLPRGPGKLAMDHLQRSGWVTAGRNLAFRIAAASFFDPVDDPALELRSRLEARPDGSVYAKGARLH